MPASLLHRPDQKYSFSRKHNDRGNLPQIPHGQAPKCTIGGGPETPGPGMRRTARSMHFGRGARARLSPAASAEENQSPVTDFVLLSHSRAPTMCPLSRKVQEIQGLPQLFPGNPPGQGDMRRPVSGKGLRDGAADLPVQALVHLAERGTQHHGPGQDIPVTPGGKNLHAGEGGLHRKCPIERVKGRHRSSTPAASVRWGRLLAPVWLARLGSPASASRTQSALMADSVPSSNTSSMLRMHPSCLFRTQPA